MPAKMIKKTIFFGIQRQTGAGNSDILLSYLSFDFWGLDKQTARWDEKGKVIYRRRGMPGNFKSIMHDPGVILNTYNNVSIRVSSFVLFLVVVFSSW